MCIKPASLVHHKKTPKSTTIARRIRRIQTPKSERERSMTSVHPAPPVVSKEEKKTEGCCHRMNDGYAHTSSASTKDQINDEKKKRRTKPKLYTPSLAFLEKRGSSSSSSSPARKNRKRRSHPGRNVFHDALDSDAATSVSCQSTSAHNPLHPLQDSRIEGDDSPSHLQVAEAEAATIASPTLAAHITDCHPLVNGWFDGETGLVDLCVGSPPPSSTVHSGVGAGDEPFVAQPPTAQRLLDRLQLGRSDGVTEHVQGRLLNTHDSHTYYGNKDNLQFMESGGAFYSFTCRTYLTPYERDMARTMANMTSFEDEQRENFVPAFDVDNIHDIEKYTFVIQKAAYLLPGVHLRDLTPELLSKTEYHKNCQPEGAEIWDHKDPNTFRFTRPIVRHVYYMTIQFKVSQIEGNDLVALSKLMGIRVDHGILMERTKRSKPPKVDGTAKAKSILCYTSVSGGVLVTHATVILNTAIPSAVSGVINTFGGLGLRETCETAEKTRRYLLRVCNET